MVTQLTLDTRPWLSCDDCFRLVDQYVEVVLDATPDALSAMSGMSAHLRGCPACLEEARTILELAADDSGLDAEHALDRLAVLTGAGPSTED
jgi:hypothetical protein